MASGVEILSEAPPESLNEDFASKAFMRERRKANDGVFLIASLKLLPFF